MVAALRVYTNFQPDSITESVRDDVVSSITNPRKKGDRETWLHGSLMEVGQRWIASHQMLYEKQPKITDFKAGTTSYGKDLAKLKEYVKVDGELERVTKGEYRSHLRSLLTTRPPVWMREFFSSLNLPNLSTLAGFMEREASALSGSGEIQILPQRGYKYRVVAKPSFWLQLGFKPLELMIAELTNRHESSCVRDATNGAYHMYNAICTGKKLWCFDLKSATDRIPLSLQLSLLKGLGLGDWIPRLREVTRGWKFEGRTIKYQVGQPMGLICSFQLLQAVHIAIVEACVTKLRGLRGLEECRFHILGDDIVLYDGDIAQEYHDTVLSAGVEISESKSVASSKIAEFAGHIALNVGRETDDALFIPYKWCKGASKESLYHLFHAWGKKAPSLRLPPSYSDIRSRYVEERTSLFSNLTPMFGEQEEGIPPMSITLTRLRILYRQYLSVLGFQELQESAEGIAKELLGMFDLSDRPYIPDPVNIQSMAKPVSVLSKLPNIDESLSNERSDAIESGPAPTTVGYEGSYLFNRPGSDHARKNDIVTFKVQ